MEEKEMIAILKKEKCCGKMDVLDCTMTNEENYAYSAICRKCGYILTIRSAQLDEEELEEHNEGMEGGEGL